MRQDKAIAIFLLSIFGVAYCLTFKFPYETAIYPRSILLLTAILSVILFVKEIIREKRKVSAATEEVVVKYTPEARYRLFASIITTLVYILLIPVLGYFITTAIYMLSLMVLLQTNKKATPVLILVSISVTIILFIVFGITLKIWVPKGLFF